MAGCYNITNVWWMRGVPECLFFKTKLILAPSYFLRASVIGPKKKKNKKKKRKIKNKIQLQFLKKKQKKKSVFVVLYVVLYSELV